MSNALSSENTNTTAPVTPAKLLVVAGCKSYNLKKGDVLDVVSIRPMGSDYSHAAAVSFTCAGRRKTMYARNVNCTRAAEFNLNCGDPCKKVRVRTITFKISPTIVLK